MKGLSVALIGAGHIAGAHLAAWRRTGIAEVTALFDVDRAAAASRAASYHVPEVFDTVEGACAAADIVDVCTPPHTHASILRAAAEAGRHVLVEKPVVTDPAEWADLRPQFETRGLSLGVVHNLKFTRSVLQAARWLERGRIGRLLRLRHQFLTSPESDRMLAAPHWSHALPGGRWFETLPHALYLTHWLAGPLRLTEVTALSTGRGIAGAAADEVAIGLAGDDVIASLHYSAGCPANRRTLVLEGETGVISIDVLGDSALLERRHDGRWARAAGPAPAGALRRLLSLVPDRGGYLIDHLAGRTPHSRMIERFARQVATGEPAPTPLDEIEYVIELGARIGRLIDERIVDGTTHEPR